MRFKSKKGVALIVSIAIVAIAGVSIPLYLFNQPKAPHKAVAITEQKIWESLNIQCGQLFYNDCRSAYETAIANRALRVSPSDDQKIVAFLQKFSKQNKKYNNNEALHLAAGWPADDSSELSKNIDPKFATALRSKNDYQILIGQPDDSYNLAGDAQTPPNMTPITIIGKNLKPLATQWFSYQVFGETLIPCNLCN